MSGTTGSLQPAKDSGDETAIPQDVPQLETAGQRVLLYLKALHIPVRKRYDLARQVLERAANACASDGDIVAEAMRCLPVLLKTHYPSSTQTTAQGSVEATQLCAHTLGSLEDMPPLNRGNMIPVAFDRTGPLKFFFFLFIKMIITPLRRPFRMYFLFLVLVGLAVLYFKYFFEQ